MVNAVVWRETADELVTEDIFGKRTIQMLPCKICKKWHPIIDFYMKSPKGWDENHGMRDRCIDCWDAMVECNKKGLRTEVSKGEAYLENGVYREWGWETVTKFLNK